ncbi:unnamed protein product [Arctogadus glacialis]
MAGDAEGVVEREVEREFEREFESEVEREVEREFVKQEEWLPNILITATTSAPQPVSRLSPSLPPSPPSATTSAPQPVSRLSPSLPPSPPSATTSAPLFLQPSLTSLTFPQIALSSSSSDKTFPCAGGSHFSLMESPPGIEPAARRDITGQMDPSICPVAFPDLWVDRHHRQVAQKLPLLERI